jgi:transposase-like protein
MGMIPILVPSARPLAERLIHRCNRYLNNRIEQDHRGIKQRYYPMRGFGNVESAARFCRAFDEVCMVFRLWHGGWIFDIVNKEANENLSGCLIKEAN